MPPSTRSGRASTLAAHFQTTKASLDTHRRKAEKASSIVKPIITSTTTSNVHVTSFAPLDSDNAKGKLQTQQPKQTPCSPKPKTTLRRPSKTSLREPKDGEVEKIMKQMSKLPPSLPTVTRSTTPPPSFPSQDRLLLTPKSKTLDLLEPVKRSPIGVRHDPDTGKLFLLLPSAAARAKAAQESKETLQRSPAKAAQANQDTIHRSPTKVERQPDMPSFSFPSQPLPSSPSKRKARDSAGFEELAKVGRSPTKNVKISPSNTKVDTRKSRLITGEQEGAGTSQEARKEVQDGLVLTPGKTMGIRMALGSPKTSPLGPRTSSAVSPSARLSARTISSRLIEDDEDLFITPRSVRERPKGVAVPGLGSTPKTAAIFRTGHEASTPSSRLSRKLDGQDPFVDTATATPSCTRLFPSSPLTTPSTTSTPISEPEPPLPQLRHHLSSDLALPSHYASLLTLHIALEHALVVHLATTGSSNATLEVESDTQDPHQHHSDQSTPRMKSKTVRLPNLISYSSLRPLVERSGGRRLGPNELKRLASVWVDFQQQKRDENHPPLDTAVDEVRGMGFIISRTRTLDPRTRKRVLDWGIGIELEVKRAQRAQTPPTEVGFAGVSMTSCSPSLKSRIEIPTTPKASHRFTTPPPSGSGSCSPQLQLHSSPSRFQGKIPGGGLPPASPSSSRMREPCNLSPSMRASSPLFGSPEKTRSFTCQAREGMSIVAMWNNGLELRKAEVGRRLRERCARFHQLWLDEHGISIPPSSRSRNLSCDPSLESSHVGTMTSDDDDGDDDHQRTAVVGEGGLLTPSATRSGGRRVGKRTIVLEQRELDRDGLADSDVSSDETDDHAKIRRSGLEGLIQETRGNGYTYRRTNPAYVKVKTQDGIWQLPAEGEMLMDWHPDFDYNHPETVRPISLATLPSLQETGLPRTPTHRSNRFGLRPGVSGLRLDPTMMTPSKTNPTSLLSQPSTPSTPKPEQTPGTPTSTAGLSLKDRIRAKEEAKRNELLRRSNSSSSLNSSSGSSMLSKSEIMATFKRHATISRLPELSSILFMLFSNGVSLSSRGVARPPTLAMSELVTKLSKSLKVTMSIRECRDAITLLDQVVPGFLEIFTVEASSATTSGTSFTEWVRVARKTDDSTNPPSLRFWRLQEVREKIGQVLYRETGSSI